MQILLESGQNKHNKLRCTGSARNMAGETTQMFLNRFPVPAMYPDLPVAALPFFLIPFFPQPAVLPCPPASSQPKTPPL